MRKLAILLAMVLMVFTAPSNAQEPEKVQTLQDEIEVVVNPDFQKYFEDNAKLQVDAEGNRRVGTVVAEFRVNAYGVPSAIQIVSGFARDTNREVIDLLVAGPRWTPSGDNRIRTIVEYK